MNHFSAKFPAKQFCVFALFFVGLASFILLSCQNKDQNKGQNKSQNKGQNNERENMLSHQDFLDKYSLLQDQEHVLVSKTAAEILSAAQSGESFVLYVGFDSCPWCQTFTPVLNQMAKEHNIPEVWYWDPKPFRGDGKEKKHSKEYLQILQLVGLQQPDSESDKGITGISRISVPLVAVINYGGLEIFDQPPITLGEGRLMLDERGEETADPQAIRYQDGFFSNDKSQVLGTYMWDDMITGYQIPSDFSDRIEWLNRPEFLDPLKKNLNALLNISVCGLCSQ